MRFYVLNWNVSPQILVELFLVLLLHILMMKESRKDAVLHCFISNLKYVVLLEMVIQKLYFWKLYFACVLCVWLLTTSMVWRSEHCILCNLLYLNSFLKFQNYKHLHNYHFLESERQRPYFCVTCTSTCNMQVEVSEILCELHCLIKRQNDLFSK